MDLNERLEYYKNKKNLHIVYYSTATQCTQKFVDKLTPGGFGGQKMNCPLKLQMCEPFILIISTYGDGKGHDVVHEHVRRFLMNADNYKFMVGVVAGGNRNFGNLFAHAANVIHEKFGVPIIHKFEQIGSPSDVRRVQEAIENLSEIRK